MRIRVYGKKLEVTSGNDLSMSFSLNGNLVLNGISVTGENGSDRLVSLQADGDNKWKIIVNDMSRLYDIECIRFDIKDELGRISLGDAQNNVRVNTNFDKSNVYTGENILIIFRLKRRFSTPLAY